MTKNLFIYEKLTNLNNMAMNSRELLFTEHQKLFAELTKDLAEEKRRSDKFRNIFMIMFFTLIFIGVAVVVTSMILKAETTASISAISSIGGSAILQAMYLMFSKQSDINILQLENERKSIRETIEKSILDINTTLSSEQDMLLKQILTHDNMNTIKDDNKRNQKSAPKVQKQEPN